MSYVVSIVRPQGPPFDIAEVIAAIARQPGFEQQSCSDATAHSLVWRGTTHLNLTDGVLWVATPSDEALAMMQALARELGAEVLGEEGEVLTAVPVSRGTGRSGCAAPAAVLLVGGTGICAGAGGYLIRILGA